MVNVASDERGGRPRVVAGPVRFATQTIIARGRLVGNEKWSPRALEGAAVGDLGIAADRRRRIASSGLLVVLDEAGSGSQQCPIRGVMFGYVQEPDKSALGSPVSVTVIDPRLIAPGGRRG
jgi:hypothetical protein